MTGGAANSENSSAWLELESDPGKNFDCAILI